MIGRCDGLFRDDPDDELDDDDDGGLAGLLRTGADEAVDLWLVDDGDDDDFRGETEPVWS